VSEVYNEPELYPALAAKKNAANIQSVAAQQWTKNCLVHRHKSISNINLQQ